MYMYPKVIVEETWTIEKKKRKRKKERKKELSGINRRHLSASTTWRGGTFVFQR